LAKFVADANSKTRSPIWKLPRTISTGTKPPPFEIQERRSNGCAGPWPIAPAKIGADLDKKGRAEGGRGYSL
jgi:hypothetical protein